MAEQKEIKKELTPEQLADRNMYREVHKMPNQKMSRRLKRLSFGKSKTSKGLNNMELTWATVLSIVFDNTKPQGKMEPYLR